MKFDFEVGDREKHRVDFEFDHQLTGVVKIHVDGKVALTGLRLFSVTLTKKWELEVGEEEKHQVVIEKTRPLLLPAFRPHSYRVLVDGTVVLERSGM